MRIKKGLGGQPVLLYINLIALNEKKQKNTYERGILK